MLAIAIIFLGASVAWIFLSDSMMRRTNESNDNLRTGVISTWGAPQVQKPPLVVRTGTLAPARIEPARSRVDVSLNIDYRQKGLLWYSTYVVDFAGSYLYRNDSPQRQNVDIRMNFPAQHAVYDGFVMQLNGQAVP